MAVIVVCMLQPLFSPADVVLGDGRKEGGKVCSCSGILQASRFARLR